MGRAGPANRGLIPKKRVGLRAEWRPCCGGPAPLCAELTSAATPFYIQGYLHPDISIRTTTREGASIYPKEYLQWQRPTHAAGPQASPLSEKFLTSESGRFRRNGTEGTGFLGTIGSDIGSESERPLRTCLKSYICPTKSFRV